MKIRHYSVLTVLALVACGGAANDAARVDSLQRDLAMAPVDSTATLNDQAAATPAVETPAPAPTPAPAARRPAPVASQLAIGTEFAGTVVDSITSKTNRAGETMRIRVSEDVKDLQGRTVIPAGSVVSLRIDQIAPAENDADKTGKLRLTPTAVEIDGSSRPLTGTVDSIKYSIVGRGVTAGDAAKVGAGAVAGALAGRVIGGNRRGTAVGAVVGAAAGVAVASETNDRDVVIRPGNYVRIQLTAAFSK